MSVPFAFVDVFATARFFNPTVGIAEDPATGTAAGPLVASLVESVAAAGDSVSLSGSRVVSVEGRPLL